MDTNRLFVPRDAELRRLAERIHDERPDLRAAFPVADGTAFWQWLGTHGRLEYHEVAQRLLPVPPEGLRATGCGGDTVATHLYTGAEDCKMLLELAGLFGDGPVASIRSVLDFGCGCGRALRWFAQALPDAALHGVDVRKASIDWCAACLPGHYVCTGIRPPLPFPDASFDLVYALSVFSHLNLDQQHAWMRELVRVTKPDGLVLASTHGAFAAAMCARSREHQQLLQIDAADARAIVRALATEPFVHRVLPAAIRASADGVADDYGQAFFGDAFARGAFAAFADYLGGVPCALNLFQDMHAWRPRRGSARP
ncbi:MAG: class I SAM-dependent methyltransferase [Planctomycetes bacterium]|nr:class I SAM-dependent methyltransferase [Planctomycetota bacterium]